MGALAAPVRPKATTTTPGAGAWARLGGNPWKPARDREACGGRIHCLIDAEITHYGQIAYRGSFIGAAG